MEHRGLRLGEDTQALNVAATRNLWQIAAMKFQDLIAIVAEEPVFETSLLLAGPGDPAHVRRQLSRWVRAGRVQQLRRGLYCPGVALAKTHPPSLPGGEPARTGLLRQWPLGPGLRPCHSPCRATRKISTSPWKEIHPDTPCGAICKWSWSPRQTRWVCLPESPASCPRYRLVGICAFRPLAKWHSGRAAFQSSGDAAIGAVRLKQRRW